uniref:Lysozyme n=1 Tax=Panagrolaimus sp. ES5 TaxID=591445 RepID=A0AC34FDA4_9BILA
MKLWSLLCAFIFFNVFNFGESAFGIDISVSATVAQLQKFRSNNTFFIARIFRSADLADPIGVGNIVKARQAGFTDVDGYIFPCSKSCKKSAITQVTEALNGLEAQNAKIGTIWLDIEVPTAWPSDVTANRKFITDMVNTAANREYSVGIYTGKSHWEGICGSWTQYSSYPLWWTRFTNVADMITKWESFGGWSSPTIHQYADTLTAYGLGYDPNVK